MARIFISYRREDTEGYAGRLYDGLVSFFGEDQVFMDIDDIPLGMDFRDVVDQALSTCAVVLALIGPRWLEVTGQYGRRLDDPDDFLRLEIVTALQRHIPVIPVLVQDAPMPDEEDLPEPMWTLVYRNGITMSHHHFSGDVRRLVTKLEYILNQAGRDDDLVQPEVFATRSFEPQTLLIPAASFIMGSDAMVDPHSTEREQPQKIVTLPRYRIGKYPVTVGQYRAFVQRGGYDNPAYWTRIGWNHRVQRSWVCPRMWEDTSWAATDMLPVVTVSWYEVIAYTAWLGTITGRTYRLPTEAEWEHAARGSTGNLYPWGSGWRERVCNTVETGIRHTSPVGRFSPHGDSPYGAADMAGNVYEWCVTKCRGSYEVDEDNDRNGHAGRVVRGGAFTSESCEARCTYRSWYFPYDWNVDIGFRVVCEVT